VCTYREDHTWSGYKPQLKALRVILLYSDLVMGVFELGDWSKSSRKTEPRLIALQTLLFHIIFIFTNIIYFLCEAYFVYNQNFILYTSFCTNKFTKSCNEHFLSDCQIQSISPLSRDFRRSKGNWHVLRCYLSTTQLKYKTNNNYILPNNWKFVIWEDKLYSLFIPRIRHKFLFELNFFIQ